MELMDDVKARPIHEIIFVTKGMLHLQTQISDVAIPYWRGEPGIAKTALSKKMCNMANMNFFATHYGQTPIEEISGLPYYNSFKIGEEKFRGTKWTIPDILTTLYKISEDKNKITVWLLDDFHLASPGMMALGYEMFTERKLRGYDIPSNVAILLAGNTSVKAGSKKNLFSAVANRCAIFPVYMDFEYWKTEYAIPNNINSKILGFLSNISYRKYVQEEEQLDRPWASYRSWTKFSNILNPLEEIGPVNMQDALYYCSAHNGEEAASKFSTYYKIFSEVEVEKIFDKKIPIIIPTDMSNQYIYMIANVSEFNKRYAEAKKDNKIDLVNIIGEIILEIAKTRIEIAVVGLKEIALSESILKLKDCYSLLKTIINTKNPLITKRIEQGINKL